LGENLLDIILALVALGVLVTVHETGHFLAARWCGVKVEVFSIGFGKPLFKTTRKGIEYKIGWLPLGGYVRMKGENLDDVTEDSSGSFQFAKWWKKIIIALSGPMANLLLALLIFILTFIVPTKAEDQRPVVGKVSAEYAQIFQPGDSITAVNSKPVKGWYQFIAGLNSEHPNAVNLYRNGKKLTLNLAKVDLGAFSNSVLPYVPAVVGEINPGMPAWRAGLKTGDIILSVDSVKVRDWYEMREKVTCSKHKSVLLDIQRGQNQLRKVIELEGNPLSEGQKIIGIIQFMPVSYLQSYPPLKAVEYGAKSTLGFIYINYVGLYKIISRPETIKSSVGGPVMIYSLSSQSAHKGWTSWILFVAAISLVLMIMNLLPIPVLDGGHIMFALAQGIMGKPVPRKVQIFLQNVGFVLLMLLMVYAFYNDFTKVFARAVSTVGKP
jgi:regulator of sigma E protease